MAWVRAAAAGAIAVVASLASRQAANADSPSASDLVIAFTARGSLSFVISLMARVRAATAGVVARAASLGSIRAATSANNSARADKLLRSLVSSMVWVKVVTAWA